MVNHLHRQWEGTVNLVGGLDQGLDIISIVSYGSFLKVTE